jgi:hypothetical protein
MLLKLPSDSRQCLTGLLDDADILTRDIAVAFIRNIKVYQDKRIEIMWNFEDELVKYVEKQQESFSSFLCH